MSKKTKKKIILLFGPTASGKSRLAVDIAKEFNGEIINADSMQVYKEVEIEDLKITVSNLSSDEIEKRKLDVNLKGVIVIDILPRSPLSRLLTPGDIIVELQRKPIKDIEDLKKVAKQIILNGKKTILI